MGSVTTLESIFYSGWHTRSHYPVKKLKKRNGGRGVGGVWEYDSGSIVVFVVALPQDWSSIWKAAAAAAAGCWRLSQNIPRVFSLEPRLNPAQRRHKTSACLPGATYTRTGRGPQEPFFFLCASNRACALSGGKWWHRHRPLFHRFYNTITGYN